MQTNDGLMKKLATLVTTNKPDLVLFVGEALCGNDGVDQLTAFNRSLQDLTEDGRGVDGVILTKFDTVDDKVGAALSMVYAAGKPIVFLGTGERYKNLKRLNVEMVVNSLLA
jgi:signal recognition particle receptor subunit alpha